MAKRSTRTAVGVRWWAKNKARSGKKAIGVAFPESNDDHVLDEPLTVMSDSLLSPQFRFATNIEHREYAQSGSVEPEPVENEDGEIENPRVDGVEQVIVTALEEIKREGDATGFYETIETTCYRFAESYQVEFEDGEIFIGDYKGNRRRIPAGYNADDAPPMRTWQVFLRDVDIDDDEKDETLDRMFTLDQCVPLWEFGEQLEEANTRTRLKKELETETVRDLTVPTRPPVGFVHDHPDHGRGTIIEYDGDRAHWTVGVEFAWGDTIEEGQDVFRHFTRASKKDWKARERAGEDLGDRTGMQKAIVILVEKRHVTVEYDDESEQRFTRSVFRRRFKPMRTYSSDSFHESFGLTPEGFRLVEITRTLGADHRTQNGRIFESGSEASIDAFAEITNLSTPGLMDPFTGGKHSRRIKTGQRGGAEKRTDPKVSARRSSARTLRHWRWVAECPARSNGKFHPDAESCPTEWIHWQSLGLDAVMAIWTPPKPKPVRDGEPVGDLDLDDINGSVTLF